MSIERNAFHLCIKPLAGCLEHGLIDGLRGFGIIADFVGPTKLAVQVIKACHRNIQHVLICEQASLLVAMDSTTRNTERMLETLRDLERRERQGEITAQVLELIGARFAVGT